LNYTTLALGNYSEEFDENVQFVKTVMDNFVFFYYAGILRTVHLYIRPQIWIEDIVIMTELNKDFSQSVVYVDVKTVVQYD
ncbi:beta-glucuronidase, partial [Streptococcus suis]